MKKIFLLRKNFKVFQLVGDLESFHFGGVAGDESDPGRRNGKELGESFDHCRVGPPVHRRFENGDQVVIGVNFFDIGFFLLWFYLYSDFHPGLIIETIDRRSNYGYYDFISNLLVIC